MKVLAITVPLAYTIMSVLGVSIYLVGDSTMAAQLPSSGMEGWGVPFQRYLTGVTLVNKARSGRSARSYWRERRWAEVQSLLRKGDYVIISFGHNDGAPGTPLTNDRLPVGGEGSDTIRNGTVETVYTWPTYIKWMIDGARSKGANPIISSRTANNPYGRSNFTSVSYNPNRVYMLGKDTTQSFFPFENTHTNAQAGANAVAQAFLSALRCPSAKGVLRSYINSAGQKFPARCTRP
ncbi:Rhamnogalacturonan acetylesterase [Ceratobasidium theobromae]|uniref:Rhamnogalacturonan acetylesterase n=1 Tax=Ceratobasidium theobromae TaxID=1582974 RepID=A0A5N5QA27_9AGAM|nr:Rhamnogalacturonan acetylesterase [Ceratobasidium theobromae]